MSEKITIANLDDVVRQNKLIHNDLQRKVFEIHTIMNTMKVTSTPQLAIQLLKLHGLIQLPINNPYFSGAIYVKEEIRIPVLNTALPRANQYFTAWHEVYHLYFDKISFNHFIGTDNIMEERKADYFASLMLLGDIMSFFNNLPENDFISKIFQCMDAFQAPYKAVLISLYESAWTNGNQFIMNEIKENFDAHFRDIAFQFRKLGLDDTLVTASNTFNVGTLSAKIQSAKKDYPEITYHNDNALFLENIIKEFYLIMEDTNA